MLDLSSAGQVTAPARVTPAPSPGVDPGSGAPRDLVPGRVLVARVLEVHGDEAVLAWGRHRLTAQVQPPLTPGSTVSLQVQEASDRLLSLRFVGQADETPAAQPVVRPDPRGELLRALGVADDDRNRAIATSLARAGRAVTATDIRAVRQGLAQLGAPDSAAPGVIWLQKMGLPLSRAALDLALALLQAGPATTEELWQTVWARLTKRAAGEAALGRLVARLPLLQLHDGDPHQLALDLQALVEDLGSPPEAKLLRDLSAPGLPDDARAVLGQLRDTLRSTRHPDLLLERAVATLAERLAAHQLGNAAQPGSLRLELPLLVDGQAQLATLIVQTWDDQQEREGGSPEHPPGAPLRLDLSLNHLGHVRVELFRRGDRLSCWLSTDDRESYQRVRGQAEALAWRLHQAVGLPAEVRWFFASPSPATPAAAEPASIDLRT